MELVSFPRRTGPVPPIRPEGSPPMTHRFRRTVGLAAAFALTAAAVETVRAVRAQAPAAPRPASPFDAVQDAQTPRAVPAARPEQQKTDHDKSDRFAPGKPAPLNPALNDQP